MTNFITQKSNFLLISLVLSGLLLLLASCASNPTLQEEIVAAPTKIVVAETIAPPTAIPTLPQPIVSTMATDTATLVATEIAAVLSTPALTATELPTLTAVPATSTVQPSATPWPTETPWPSPTTPPTITPPPPAPKRPVANAVPGNPTSYLDNYQLITFYGSPWGRGLGILGNYPYEEMVSRLRGVVAPYQPLDRRFAMPTFHMITTVANKNPPEYRHLVDIATIENWIQSAKFEEGAAIIDIQPGRVKVMDEFYRVRQLLYNTHVHLAIDPEFVMNDQQIPGQQVGQLDAATINQLQQQLSQIANEMGVKRVLILHQFKDSMLPDKHLIQNYPNVELVIDSDGTFNTDIKIYNYNQYARESGFEYGGIKIFYNYDDWIMSPEQVMNLNPRPAIIIYQ